MTESGGYVRYALESDATNLVAGGTNGLLARGGNLLEILVVEHSAEPESQAVLGEQLRHDRVEGASVLVGTRIAVDGLHLRRRQSQRAQHALLNVRAEVDW